MTLLEQLENATNLTPVEQEVAEYILENKDEIINLTILDLANVTYTSNATIIRLCRKLGAKGYKDFKVQLVKDIERRRKKQRDINMNFPVEQLESSDDITKMMADLSKEAIDICYETIDNRDLEKAAKMIMECKNVYFFGTGDSLINAIAFSNRLIKLRKPAIIASQYGEVDAHAYSMKKDDLGIFVSYSGRSFARTRTMNIARKRGSKLILISSERNIPGFDLVVNFPKKEAYDGKMATFYSQISINYIFNCLYAILFTKYLK